jgi:rhamnosyltransferase
LDLIVYNNGMNEYTLDEIQQLEIEVLGNGINVGVAQAFNELIDHVFDNLGQDTTIIFDQDSKPTDQLIRNLVAESQSNANNRQLVVLAPSLAIRDTRQTYGRYSVSKKLIEAATLASSGKVIERLVWEKVGKFDETLFIDYVDHEWCIRAKGLGVKLCILPTAQMRHEMGDGTFRLFNYYKPVHRSPTRHYYIVRNYLLLCRRAYIPMRWKVIELFKTTRRITFYLIASSNRKISGKLIIKAIKDGLINKSGPLI